MEIRTFWLRNDMLVHTFIQNKFDIKTMQENSPYCNILDELSDYNWKTILKLEYRWIIIKFYDKQGWRMKPKFEIENN